MSIKTGSAPYEFVGNEKVTILCESTASVFEVDEDGQPKKFLVSGSNRLQFRTKGPIAAFVSVPGQSHWSIEVEELPDPFDKADPRPVEIPEELAKEVTLEDKLKQFVADMVAERYGADSDQMETLEEALDLDMDDEDELPLSGYEVNEMDEVEPPAEPAAEPPKPVEEPEEPQPSP